MTGSTEIGRNYETLRLGALEQTENRKFIYGFLLSLQENIGQHLKHSLPYSSHIIVILSPYTSSRSHSTAD
jgi:hypothetical protein